MAEITKESLAQWIAELESQPHLSLKEERYLAVMRELNYLREDNDVLRNENSVLWGRLNDAYQVKV